MHTRTVKKTTKALVVTSKETGLELNADKTVRGHGPTTECRTKSQYKNWQ